MPAAKKSAIATKKTSESVEEIQLGRMRKIKISNFRAIGPTPVSIDLNNIVVLVGPNNAGKSSILRAYELIMLDGSKAGQITGDDFPNGKIDPENLPTIELETEVLAGQPAAKWIINDGAKQIVRERWVFDASCKGKRSGWDSEKNSWDETQVPWGAPNVANSRRPKPHSVAAFDSPEKQADEINKIVMIMIKEKARAIEAEGGGSEFAQILEQLGKFQEKVLDQAKADIEEIESRLNEMVAAIFANHVVKFNAIPQPVDKSIELFSGGSRLLVGPTDGHKSPLELQGSGARRTLLWAVLKTIAERESATGSRPHLLLIDEPELCLHPNAIREACRVLYDLADKSGWQVIVTTHSPVFIDLSRDNTTVVRVERKQQGEITGTTLFRPETVQLSVEDKKNLQLLNLYDPYVAEFFFGGITIVVEGDTEYAAFKQVVAVCEEMKDKSPLDLLKLRNLQIIRARGKATIASVAKILNHFGSSYSILHDADTPTITVVDKQTGQPKAQKNPAWTSNAGIMEAVQSAPNPEMVRVVASVENFETAYLGCASTKEKPYNAVKCIKDDPVAFQKVSHLLNALMDHTKPLPEGAVEADTLIQPETEQQKTA